MIRSIQKIGGGLMSSLSEARAAYQHKQQLEQQLEKLKEEAA